MFAALVETDPLGELPGRRSWGHIERHNQLFAVLIRGDAAAAVLLPEEGRARSPYCGYLPQGAPLLSSGGQNGIETSV